MYSSSLNIFLIQSPLQLLNAMEAKHHFCLPSEDCILIIVGNQDSYSTRLINSATEPSDWSSIIRVSDKGIGSFYSRKIQLNKIATELTGARRVFIGDYLPDHLRHFANTIPTEEIYVLDDGNVTLHLFNILADGGLKFGLKNLLKKIVFGINNQNIPHAKFFTIYSSSTHSEQIVPNNYSYLKSKFLNSAESDTIYFLGAPISERNIIKEEYYFQYLDKIFEYFTNETLSYIPHRNESEIKLRTIENRYNIQITQPNKCIELSLCEIKPKLISSFYSSALDTIDNIFDRRIPIKSFLIPSEAISKKHRKEIESVYENYRKRLSDSFEIISLM